ncbi:MAG: conjugal transfer protein TraK [Sphingomonadales bacterium 28-64-96]|nr:MAG: conjugal transfer protein TraK [Sphingomonadales bacterium 28-64-96]
MRIPVALAASLVAVMILSPPALADQYRMAADNARIECVASKKDLTRISLVSDQFASVSKVATGIPYNDFSVVNEPLRGDIYISVPETYAARTINFFATSKKGYVYKFVCQVAPVEAQQVFLTNPAIAETKARDWEQETPIQTTAMRLIQAMATQATVEGYEVHQPVTAPVSVGPLSVRLIAEYRGAQLIGKALRIENKGAVPLTLKEAELAPQGTLAVTIARPELAPGEATSAWLVRTGER